MIVVDSSVWIAWLRGLDTPETAKLLACHPSDILVGDLVMLEILRGAPSEARARDLEARLRKFEMATMLNSSLAVRAASNYRRLRSLGFTIRSVSDLLIGTFCIEGRHALLQKDRDFLPMAHLGLRLI